MRIKKNEYHIPSRISKAAATLIAKLLKSDPTDRPNMDQILDDEFLHCGKCNLVFNPALQIYSYHHHVQNNYINKITNTKL